MMAVPLAAQQWNGGGISDSVSDMANWNPSGAPANDGTADLVFDGATRTSPDFDSAWDARSISFASGADAFSLSGSAITLGGAPGSLTDVRLSVQSTTGQSIGNSLLIGRDQTWNSTAGGDLTLTNQVDLAGRALRLDFGGGTAALQDAGRFSSATPANLQIASGTLLLNGRHDTGAASSTVDRIGSNIIVQLNGGNLTLVSDDNSGHPASLFTEVLGTVSVSGSSKLSVIPSVNHTAGARLNLGSLSLAESSTLETYVEGAGNRLDLGTSVSVGSGRTLGISTANGGIVSTSGFGGINVQQGGTVNFARDAAGVFGSLNSNLSVAGIADFDSAGGANDFAINGSLTLSQPATVRMTLGDSGSDSVQVNGSLVLDGTLELTENASSSLTGSGLHKIFGYTGSLTNNRMQLAGGADFSGNPNWKFAITTAFANEVNLVASEIRSWDGQGGDGLFSTATNWNSDKALASFDHLVFDPAANTTITNDFVPGVAFGGIELGGTNNADVVLNGSQAFLSSGIVVHGGNHTLNLDLTPNALDFESDTIHVADGSVTFNGNVTMLPGLNLKMEVADGSSVTFNGNISGSKLFKTGTTLSGGQSTVTLNGVGTFNGTAGGSSITQGDFVLGGVNGRLDLSGNPQLDLKGLPDSRSRLILDNSVAANGNRISDNSLIAMFGNSTVKFVGNATTGVTENLAGLALFDGVTTFEFDAPAGVASGMVFQSFPVNAQRTASNYLAVSDTSGALGTGGANPFLKFTNGIAHNTLVGRGSYNDTDFLVYDSTTGLRAATTTTTTVGATAADNLRLDTNESINSP
ncbi:MAG: hypothetical protein KDN05_16350, partial [Verrucomicrobiae bacterium]|nr:hypothetical protein [Verrucomicrobiae bacterium]